MGTWGTDYGVHDVATAGDALCFIIIKIIIKSNEIKIII
jgi:hypothetical protein